MFLFGSINIAPEARNAAGLLSTHVCLQVILEVILYVYSVMNLFLWQIFHKTIANSILKENAETSEPNWQNGWEG